MSGRASVSQADIVKSICEFCRVNGFHNAVKTLQQESLVPYNAIPCLVRNPDSGNVVNTLEVAVKAGRWGEMLRLLDSLLLTQSTQYLVMEVVLTEMALPQVGLRSAAQQLLHHSPIMRKMKTEQPTRHDRIEAFLNSTPQSGHVMSAAELIAKREQVWTAVSDEVTFVEKESSHRQQKFDAHKEGSSALMQAVRSVLGDAGGSATTAERSLRKRARDDTDVVREALIPNDIIFALGRGDITPTSRQDSHAAVVVAGTYAPPAAGRQVATPIAVSEESGVYAFEAGTIRQVAKPYTKGYRAYSIDACVAGADGHVRFAIGYHHGLIRVMQFEDTADAKLLRKLGPAKDHSMGVTHLKFLDLEGQIESAPATRGNFLVSGDVDGNLTLHSIQSGKSWKIVTQDGDVPHTGSISCLVPIVAANGTVLLLTGSLDGNVRIWSLPVYSAMLKAIAECASDEIRLHSRLVSALPSGVPTGYVGAQLEVTGRYVMLSSSSTAMSQLQLAVVDTQTAACAATINCAVELPPMEEKAKAAVVAITQQSFAMVYVLTSFGSIVCGTIEQGEADAQAPPRPPKITSWTVFQTTRYQSDRYGAAHTKGFHDMTTGGIQVAPAASMNSVLSAKASNEFLCWGVSRTNEDSTVVLKATTHTDE